MKYLALLLALILFLLAPMAQASTCRQNKNKTICIIEIKRSALNYWEYRASVSIDGMVQPIEKYNCRTLVKTNTYGKIIPFEKNGAGELICSFFKKA